MRRRSDTQAGTIPYADKYVALRYIVRVALKATSDAEYEALADLRYRLRQFVAFSEEQARAVGLEPRQHQLLLAVRGLPPALRPTIGTLAERLVVKHHTAVEHVDRLEAIGLVQRQRDPDDGRGVLVVITTRGRAMLERLTSSHRTELAKLGPSLVAALQTIVGPS
jgi:DNA-binding MarR family transcriptional regulator